MFRRSRLIRNNPLSRPRSRGQVPASAPDVRRTSRSAWGPLRSAQPYGRYRHSLSRKRPRTRISRSASPPAWNPKRNAGAKAGQHPEGIILLNDAGPHITAPGAFDPRKIFERQIDPAERFAPIRFRPDGQAGTGAGCEQRGIVLRIRDDQTLPDERLPHARAKPWRTFR